jgi:hypothetical protein
MLLDSIYAFGTAVEVKDWFQLTFFFGIKFDDRFCVEGMLIFVFARVLLKTQFCLELNLHEE